MKFLFLSKISIYKCLQRTQQLGIQRVSLYSYVTKMRYKVMTDMLLLRQYKSQIWSQYWTSSWPPAKTLSIFQSITHKTTCPYLEVQTGVKGKIVTSDDLLNNLMGFRRLENRKHETTKTQDWYIQRMFEDFNLRLNQDINKIY